MWSSALLHLLLPLLKLQAVPLGFLHQPYLDAGLVAEGLSYPGGFRVLGPQPHQRRFDGRGILLEALSGGLPPGAGVRPPGRGAAGRIDEGGGAEQDGSQPGGDKDIGDHGVTSPVRIH